MRKNKLYTLNTNFTVLWCHVPNFTISLTLVMLNIFWDTYNHIFIFYHFSTQRWHRWQGEILSHGRQGPTYRTYQLTCDSLHQHGISNHNIGPVCLQYSCFNIRWVSSSACLSGKQPVPPRLWKKKQIHLYVVQHIWNLTSIIYT